VNTSYNAASTDEQRFTII